MDTSIAALDLDHCRDPETGQVDAWAQEILDASPAAYVEVTVSGTGLRIIGIATGGEQHKKFAISGARHGAAIEVYRKAVRYITVSGLELSHCTELPNIDQLIDDIVARHENGGNGFDFDKVHPPSFFAHRSPMSSKTPPIPPLFEADAATLSFYASKTGAISVPYQGWDASKVVLALYR
jgi:hypothetical protein